jgi:prepilin-type N-terminal cleavage/methylation domain-containing protein
MKHFQKAFTLLELLVVITIIGILSSIVIVSMSGSTDSATIAKGKAYAQQVHALLGANTVGVWNFDEGIVNTCSVTQDACDISGYNNHGTFVGDTHFIDSDVEGYALSFDGTGDYVDCGTNNSLKIAGSLTIETWVNPASIGSENWRDFISYSPGDDAKGYSVQLYIDGRIRFWASNGVRIHVYSNTVLTAGYWHHVVAYYDGTKIGTVIDGVVQSNTTDKTDEIGQWGLSFKIGSPGSPYNYFSGLIDEVRIYVAALPSTEIQKHYVQGLNKLLSNQVITQVEYDQRMEEFNQSLVSNRF